jgi:hypothetical protein
MRWPPSVVGENSLTAETRRRRGYQYVVASSAVPSALAVNVFETRHFLFANISAESLETKSKKTHG